jgi:hypothetical protein
MLLLWSLLLLVVLLLRWVWLLYPRPSRPLHL